MATDITKLQNIRQQYDDKLKEVERVNKELGLLYQKLTATCTHPTYTEGSIYSRGGYDHVSSVTIQHRCTICDKVIKSYEDKNHKGSYS